MKTTQKINNLVAVSEAITKDKFRGALRCIHFKGDVAEATNGFILLQVKGCEDMGDVLVPADAIKNSKKTAIKDLVNVEIEIEEKSGTIDNGLGVQKFTTNSDNFPDTSKVASDESGNHVSLGVDQLSILVKAMKRMGIAWVTFNVLSDPNKPVSFVGRPDKNFTGVIMPIRSED